MKELPTLQPLQNMTVIQTYKTNPGNFKDQATTMIASGWLLFNDYRLDRLYECLFLRIILHTSILFEMPAVLIDSISKLYTSLTSMSCFKLVPVWEYKRKPWRIWNEIYFCNYKKKNNCNFIKKQSGLFQHYQEYHCFIQASDALTKVWCSYSSDQKASYKGPQNI